MKEQVEGQLPLLAVARKSCILLQDDILLRQDVLAVYNIV